MTDFLKDTLSFYSVYLCKAKLGQRESDVNCKLTH